jgi:hypothetical protein
MNIAIAGQKQNGKDEAANAIVEEMGEGWKRIAFADQIKDTFCELYGVTREWIEEWKERKENPPNFNMTVRQALQLVGDDFRKIKDDVWIVKAFQNGGNEGSVGSDSRYLNELKTVRELGGINILIYRPGFLNDIDHPSEKQLRPILDWFIEHNIPEGKFQKSKIFPLANLIDYFYINDGSLMEWISKMKKFANHYLK